MMKPPPAAIVLCCCAGIASCDRARPPIDYGIPAGPARVKAAAANVRPELERALQARGLGFGDPVFLRAFKRERTFEVFVKSRRTGRFELFRSYAIAAASGVEGPKLAEGDGQVPEGFYFVPPSAMKPDSAFHLAFNIGYPNRYDRERGRTGSFIMVHGNRVSIGCLAMTDEKIEEIYTLCDAALKSGQRGIRIHIFPFRMTREAMAAAAGDPNLKFWQNLKQGYDLFETTMMPPEVSVEAGDYVFAPRG